ncbi:hypothetical protein AB1Y20_022604 [Prymnesium parvum]|uniref:PNPLA domain-containing protein n=1 Tax=Prymnesium parvum TaxID=97485 RepID=A0AB34JK31_PRYPA
MARGGAVEELRDALTALLATQTASSSVDRLAQCAVSHPRAASACHDALVAWRSAEALLAPLHTTHASLPLDPLRPTAARWVALSMLATLALLCLVLGWRWLIWLAVSLVMIVVRVTAASHQSLMLALSLLLYALTSLVRNVVSLSSRFSFLSSRRREIDAILKAGAHVSSSMSYEEWTVTAAQRDELSGAAAWRDDGEGLEELLAHEEQLAAAQRAGARALKFALAPLVKQARPVEPAVAMAGGRHLAERHTETLCACLEALARAPSDELPEEEKLRFFSSAQLALGHTALCLSGGGSLAMYHMGVVRALLEQGLLPKVISGTSGGSIVAGFLTMRTDEELLRDVLKDHISTCFEDRWFPPLHEQVSHFLRSGVLVRSEDFEKTTRAYYGTVTFAEAYQRTGRHVNISICSTTRGGGRGQSVLLNHITTPSVLVHSAVAASCALPGIMRPATLLAKDSSGRIVPMDPPGTKWVDGTMRADLPMQRLSQLFNVSHFIVSQVNPHIAPFIESSSHKLQRSGSGFVRSLTVLQRHLMRDVQQRYRALSSLHMLPTFFGEDAQHLMQQRYHGSITIVPALEMSDFWRAIMNPTVSDMRHYLSEGRLRTWEKLAAIRQMQAVERAIELHRLQAQAAVERLHPPSVSVIDPTSSLPHLSLATSSSWSRDLSLAVHSANLPPKRGAPSLPTAAADEPPPRPAPWQPTYWTRCLASTEESQSKGETGGFDHSQPPPLPTTPLPEAPSPALSHLVPILREILRAALDAATPERRQMTARQR